VTAKGKMVSDLHVHCLRDELLLDFEPGLGPTVQQRLEQYVIADDVQIVDVAPHYTLWSVQGPSAEAALTGARLFDGPLPGPGQSIQVESPTLGEICCARHARGTTDGFDLFVPVGNIPALAAALTASAQSVGGGLAGWTALEWVRIEAGLPRFGQDMDETNLPPEAGLESRAISYSKGCYIGQEIIARIRTYGQVAKSLRGLILPENLPTLPTPGTRLTLDGKEVGYITSSLHSPRWNKPIALGYVRKECLSPGTQLTLAGGESQGPAQVVPLPFSLT
jgi:folate-binding protein YgfZ